jgi:hypothetical protein
MSQKSTKIKRGGRIKTKGNGIILGNKIFIHPNRGSYSLQHSMLKSSLKAPFRIPSGPSTLQKTKSR